jgi:D-sedoheptulose 7-phosphate isomerase
VDAEAMNTVNVHLDNVVPALESLRAQSGRLAAWGVELAQRLLRGQRLLAAGNGGSAAEAQHLTAELVGRFDGERVPFSAISLHAESSALTALANDYGYEEVFARQAAAGLCITTWALTGSGPNPLANACDEAVTINALNANAQEAHLMALHAVCRAFDLEVRRRGSVALNGPAPSEWGAEP